MAPMAPMGEPVEVGVEVAAAPSVLYSMVSEASIRQA